MKKIYWKSVGIALSIILLSAIATGRNSVSVCAESTKEGAAFTKEQDENEESDATYEKNLHSLSGFGESPEVLSLGKTNYVVSDLPDSDRKVKTYIFMPEEDGEYIFYQQPKFKDSDDWNEYFELQAGCILKDDTGNLLAADKIDGKTGLFCVMQELAAGKSYTVSVGWSGIFAESGLYKENFDIDGYDAKDQGNEIWWNQYMYFYFRVVKAPKSMTIEGRSQPLFLGIEEQMAAKSENAVIDNTLITWKSSDPKVAGVDYTGKVVAHGYGSCTITAIAINGETASRKLSVDRKYVYQCRKGSKYQYTVDKKYVKKLREAGWSYSKVFCAVGKSSSPVYWIYDKSTDAYRFTTDRSYSLMMKKKGNNAGIAFYGSPTSPRYWIYYKSKGSYEYTESRSRALLMKKHGKNVGIVFYGNDKKGNPVYELCKTGKKVSNFYTTKRATVKSMMKSGWVYKGVAWYAA